VTDAPKLSPKAILVLEAISLGHVYGYSIMLNTKLQSGTIYPILSRLERDELILSQWEKRGRAEEEQRPARKYYRLTRDGVKRLQKCEGAGTAAESVLAGAGGRQ